MIDVKFVLERRVSRLTSFVIKIHRRSFVNSTDTYGKREGNTNFRYLFARSYVRIAVKIGIYDQKVSHVFISTSYDDTDLDVFLIVTLEYSP